MTLKRTSLATPRIPTTGKPVVFNAPPNGTYTWGVANALRGSFVTVWSTITVTAIRVYTTISSGNISAAIYDTAGTTRLATTGTVACPGANNNTAVSLTSSVILSPGLYFIGMSCDNTTAQFHASTTSQILGGAATTTSHPAPSTVTVDNASAGVVPVLGLVA